MLRTVRATRYVTPLREGGSLPAIVEADDLGLYVVKFRGSGQGALALVAELIAGEIARAAGLQVPELVFIEIDGVLGRNEPDPEIRDLLGASAGLNLALDYLPGATMFDPAARDSVAGPLASRIVWFDAFVTNVDRTAKNPNMLLWHKTLYLIDHGAALYFHHDWESSRRFVASPFAAVRQHVLLPWAENIEDVAPRMREKLTDNVLGAIVDQVPESWLAEPKRSQYASLLSRRLNASSSFVEEAVRARALLV